VNILEDRKGGARTLEIWQTRGDIRQAGIQKSRESELNWKESIFSTVSTTGPGLVAGRPTVGAFRTASQR